jgi:hypothetical protein
MVHPTLDLIELILELRDTQGCRPGSYTQVANLVFSEFTLVRQGSGLAPFAHPISKWGLHGKFPDEVSHLLADNSADL